ncbi:MAG: hypothetical protein HYS24_13820 [Ignavibacteriales bacterium]|nr:hypothetical protein [Ignavibacteriales bacterium]
MKTFKYTLFSRLFYKYSIIPVNLILAVYILISLLSISSDWRYIFPLLIKLILFYIFNRFYIRMYKSFPFTIEINNEELICHDFIFNNRKVEIKHNDITDITGGLFAGRSYTPIYIFTSKEKVGISPHLKDYNELLKIILTNVTKEVYMKSLSKIEKNTIITSKKKK